MKYCENCTQKHDGSYGTGRFCSDFCAHSFCTKHKRTEINAKVSKALTGRKYPQNKQRGQKRPGVSQSLNEYWSKKWKDNISTLPFSELSKKEKRLKLLDEQNDECSECGIFEEWNNKPLLFELDHIDGNKENNLRVNLRLICPNCHQQTPTYKGKNVKKRK